MNQDRTSRKLTAIFSADVVGYSRLMEADESWTIKSLEENKKLMSSLIKEYNGRVVDSPGDNLLAEFNSVINAVESAVKVQEQLNIKNSKLMEDNRMHFRIGVNLGDVVEEEDRIYGNGVNIAARLEGLAEPGGICISGTAYDQIISKLNLKYDYLGEHSVKNIVVPVRAYRVLIDTEAAKKVVGEKSFFGKIRITNFITWIVSSVILTAIIVGATIWNLRTPQRSEIIQLSYNLPENQHIVSFGERTIAISPDGRQLVYQTEEGLYLRSIAKKDAKLIRGTQGAHKPFFSPDGLWIGYVSGGGKELKKVPVDGGGSSPIANINSTGFLSWDTAHGIIYAQNGANKIMKVSAGGGNPEVLIVTEKVCFAPQILPDGKTVMYTTGAFPYKIVTQSIGSSEAKDVISGDSAQYLPSGHIVYVEGNNLYVVAFDLEKLKTNGSRTHIVEGILRAGGAPHYAVSDSGMLVYLPGSNLSSQTRFEWSDRDGNSLGFFGEPGQYNQFVLSPDEKKVIVQKQTPSTGNDLWMLELNRTGSGTPVANSQFSEGNAVWSPNGDYIVYSSDQKGFTALYRKSMIVEEQDVLLLESKVGNLYAEDWSKNGHYIAYLEVSDEGNKIFILPLSGESKPEFIVGGQYNYDEPKFSPDSKMIAYVSSESGSDEIWIKPLAEDRPFKVSANGGGQPLWRDDGKELFFLALDGTIMAVDMENPSDPGLPKPLFQASIFVSPGIDQYAVTGDGQKFLIMNQGKTNISSINIFFNWFEELKERGQVD